MFSSRRTTRCGGIAVLVVFATAGDLLADSDPSEVGGREVPTALREAPPSGPQPKLQVEPQVWEFGTVWSGMPVSTMIKLTNVGDAPLKLKYPHGCCGRVGVIIKQRELASGESTEIKVSYNSRDRLRDVHQAVFIHSNDPVNPRVRVPILGIVEQTFGFRPKDAPFVSFGLLHPDQRETRELLISNLFAEALEGRKIKLALPPEIKSEHFDYKLEELEPGMEYKLMVTTKPPLPDESLSERINLTTDLDWMDHLRIGVSAWVEEPFSTIPEVLYISTKLTSPSQKMLRVRNWYGDDFNIEHISCNSKAISWDEPKLVPDVDCKCYEMSVSVPPGNQIPSEGYELIVTTDVEDPRYKQLKVLIKPHEIPTIRLLPKPRETAPDAADAGQAVFEAVTKLARSVIEHATNTK